MSSPAAPRQMPDLQPRHRRQVSPVLLAPLRRRGPLPLARRGLCHPRCGRERGRRREHGEHAAVLCGGRRKGRPGLGALMSDSACRLVQLEAPERHPELVAQVEAIFWETSARTFAPGPERDAFRERWLGRYMQGGSDVVLLALAGDGHGGRLCRRCAGEPGRAGALRRHRLFPHRLRRSHEALPRAPAHQPRRRFPQPRHRRAADRGLRRRARHAGAPGMHAVTGKGMRNVGFYTRCGFVERATRPVERPRDRVPRPRALVVSRSRNSCA